MHCVGMAGPQTDKDPTFIDFVAETGFFPLSQIAIEVSAGDDSLLMLTTLFQYVRCHDQKTVLGGQANESRGEWYLALWVCLQAELD
jgi:hypothetical protein